MVAIAELPVPQVTIFVASCVEPSEKVPIAVIWRVDPVPTVGDCGLIANDASDFTNIVIVPETPNVAVIEVEPIPLPVATPREPDALLMVATATFDELQVTRADTSCVEPLAKVATAVNVWVVPTTTVGLAGVTTINIGPSTVSVAVLETPEKLAVTVVEPSDREEATPLALIEAMPVFVTLHVTREVTSCATPFDNVAVAISC
jgi:hypothetical protein